MADVQSDPAVLDADHEQFWTGFIRAELVKLAADTTKTARIRTLAAGVTVDRKEPEASATSMPVKLIVVRDDGTTDTSIITGDTSMGISVLAGSRENPADAKTLARIVKAIVKTAPRVEAGNPVAVIREFNGPYLVPEAALRARAYMTFTAGTVGEAL